VQTKGLHCNAFQPQTSVLAFAVTIFERDAARSARAVRVIAGFGSLLPPTESGDGSEQSRWRWMATGVAAALLAFELFWIVAFALLSRKPVKDWAPIRAVRRGWFQPTKAVPSDGWDPDSPEGDSRPDRPTAPETAASPRAPEPTEGEARDVESAGTA